MNNEQRRIKMTTLDMLQYEYDMQSPCEKECSDCRNYPCICETCDDCEEPEEECTCRHIDWEDRFQAQETY